VTSFSLSRSFSQNPNLLQEPQSQSVLVVLEVEEEDQCVVVVVEDSQEEHPEDEVGSALEVEVVDFHVVEAEASVLDVEEVHQEGLEEEEVRLEKGFSAGFLAFWLLVYAEVIRVHILKVLRMVSIKLKAFIV